MSNSTLIREGGFEVNRTYEPYSDDPDYIAGNRGFLENVDLARAQRILDLACGIGTLSRLALERHPVPSIIGLDISLDGLRIAKTRLGEQTTCDESGRAAEKKLGRVKVRFVAGSADAIALADDSVDTVLMSHAIHMLPDSDRLLSEVARVLRPGGQFAFNSSFYAGTFVDNTEAFYHDWIMEAIKYIREKDRRLRAAGAPGIKRKRGSAPQAFSNAWPSPEQWQERLERHGFSVASVSTRIVPLTQYSFESIGAYAGFAEVLLSGYPVEHSCEALQAAAGPTFAAAGVGEIDRNWLEIVATNGS